MKHNIGHSCTVEKQTSGSFLPPLPKEANCFQRCIRAYKKFIQVSIKDPLTQEYFRSTTGFLNERKRHAQSKYSYIIHPFSDFAFCRSTILFIALGFAYICAPLVASFIPNGVCYVKWIYTLELMSTVVFLFDIFVKFFIGIENKETRQIILDHKRVARRYVASIEFLLDVLTAFSFCTVHRMVNLQKHYYLALFRLLKIFKLFSFLKYWTLVAQRWNFSAVATELVKYFAMTMILIHWTTCLFYYVTISYILIGEEIEEEDYDTHFVLEGNITALYFACLYETMGILYYKLKREINIQVCKRLVQQAAFLADLPTKVLGDVLTHLKSEVFLPNDVIIRAGAPGDCMYFLSSGTVLVTTPSGKEVCHLQDGAYFGEIALLSKETKRTANVIALEICETYRLDKKVFKMSIKKYPDCVKVIQALAEIRHQETNALEEMHKEELFHKTYIGENETLEGSLKIPRRYRSESS
ncbi:potassium/sodium hyperpolarization-activated cyclic nucleotide-gated channel 2-like isoform X3 [Coccinella septempunctata]|uniref:potassium/sodium hyperpolarization-activated cyclic nucleotide-gated channel 2-like isoform X3 n=1 Tax=Coccinella septempunctata TaxID=41139 RepID=UPI001D06A045|nr:potassium/sodium hyperpolarization-activated cyclic nucleotide-gated channel 2-like isoform X3 [Coccinella septempunctata]